MEKQTVSYFERVLVVVGVILFGALMYARIVMGIPIEVYWLAIPGALIGITVEKFIGKR